MHVYVKLVILFLWILYIKCIFIIKTSIGKALLISTSEINATLAIDLDNALVWPIAKSVISCLYRFLFYCPWQMFTNDKQTEKSVLQSSEV